jgi:capsular polysaccharide transport system permease protein
MITKLNVPRYRTRRPEPLQSPPQARVTQAQARPEVDQTPTPQTVAPKTAAAKKPAPPAQETVIGDTAFFPEADADGFGDVNFKQGAAPADKNETAPADIDAIRKENLTGRELRMARRLAQKHGLPATSDFDAVRLLRNAGLNPFQTNSVLEMVANDSPSRALTLTPGGDGVQLPQTMKPAPLPSAQNNAENAHIAEVAKIQRDIVARRQRKSLLLMARLFVFVGLPTLLAGFYYYRIATPLYNSHTEFVIQQAESASTGLGSLIKGSAFATSQDSIAVQGYLQSQDAMERLDKDIGFRSHFDDPHIDPIQRIDADSSNTALYKVYRRNVKISYDPTEGLIKMEVIAADPQVAVSYSKALIGYAEEQVDQLTARLRGDQMKGALEAYQDAEKKLTDANMRVVELQEKNKILSSEVEISLVSSQIGQLDTQLTAERLSLAQMESNANPNRARMDPIIRRIATLEDQISILRNKMTEGTSTDQSLARVQSELLVAQADVATRQLLLSTALTAMEAARNEANRQTRYLSISVNPVAADEAAYPLAFENTLVVMLIFAGIYLMISMTVAILHEQVTA